jgi:HEAT repeats
MTDATRQRVRSDVPEFLASALIVTSRLEERLGDQPKATLQPMRVTGDYLIEFMGAYLRAQGVRAQFLDREFSQASTRISDLVGDREVTVLLVKLYLDRLIAATARGGDLDKEMPESIPSLMLQYLNDINRAVPDEVRREERAVHRDAEAVAWACLEELFRPGVAEIDHKVIPKLTAIAPAEEKERLAYLEIRLRLIETLEPERERIKFQLDPVAEYLAGLHLVHGLGPDEPAWRALLEQFDASEGGLESIRGFVLALRDCCLYRPHQVPVLLADELARRGSLDLDALKEARTRERVARYARQLSAPDPDDRRIAAEALETIGAKAAAAVPALTRALEDKDEDVRRAAAQTLGLIRLDAAASGPGPNQGSIQVPYATDALRQIRTQAMPALVARSRPGWWCRSCG